MESSEKLLLTLSEAADLLGISITTLYKLINEEGLPTVSIGKRLRRIYPNDLKSWLEKYQSRKGRK